MGGAENLKKAKSWQEEARKKKVILGILAVVLVLILLLVILSEFGAFSGGGGETTIIEKNIYITKLSDGTEIESEEPPKDWKSNDLVPLTTTTTTSAPSASDVAEGSEIAEDYIEWEE